MSKRALFAVAGLLGLCHSLSAQTQSTEQLQTEGSALYNPSLRLPSLRLEDQERFFFSTSFGSIQTAPDFLPSFNPVESPGAALANGPSRSSSDSKDVELRSADRIHVGGEVGFLYGKSSGKYGREFEQGYVIGELGNDKFHITVGTSYERSSGRVPRWGR